MLQIAIVVFREVLEVSIILGVILAATKGVASRGRWAWLGIAMGLAGSCAVAYFINEISAMAEGVGQEIFNAGILIVAALVIGWTVLWMRAQAKTMVAKLKKVGEGIREGNIHMFAISTIIALAVLREGGEIILFGNGILRAGNITINDFSIGALIGLAGGATVGGLLYFGLIQIPTKHIFKITSWLLIFLAAGMMSIAASYLVSAGIFNVLTQPVWDTSNILSDSSITGRILSGLIGYTAMPMGIQLVFYFLTLGVLAMSSTIISIKHSNKKTVAVSLVAAAFFFAGSHEALATKKVYSPYVEKGELEIEYRGNYTHDDDRVKDGEQENKIGIGYGFTDYWFSELYIEEKNDAGNNQPYKLDAVEWENKFQLTQPGEYWADLGLLLEYEIPIADSHAPDELTILALVEKDYDKWANMLNIGIGREIGENSGSDTTGLLSFSTRYRYMPEFEPGFEYHGNFGDFDRGLDAPGQSHQIGPVFYGELGYGFSYDIGYLFSIGRNAPNGEAKFLIEYGIPIN